MLNAIGSALSGLISSSKKIEGAAENIANPQNQDRLIEDIVDIKIAETSYRANLKVLQVTQDLSEELINSFDKKV